MTHDPMCRWRPGLLCDCRLIADVRADERERLWAALLDRVKPLIVGGVPCDSPIMLSDVRYLIEEGATRLTAAGTSRQTANGAVDG